MLKGLHFNLAKYINRTQICAHALRKCGSRAVGLESLFAHDCTPACSGPPGVYVCVVCVDPLGERRKGRKMNGDRLIHDLNAYDEDQLYEATRVCYLHIHICIY